MPAEGDNPLHGFCGDVEIGIQVDEGAPSGCRETPIRASTIAPAAMDECGPNRIRTGR